MGNSATWYYDNCENCVKCNTECIPEKDGMCDKCSPIAIENRRIQKTKQDARDTMQGHIYGMSEQQIERFLPIVEVLAKSVKSS